MQLTGGRFTSETALLGQRPRDASPTSRPRSARRPARCPGVSGFQLHFADHDILTPGDRPDVLVAMNPAALKTNLRDLPKGGTLIVDTDAFTERNLKKAGYATNPLEDGSLADYQVHAVQLTSMTVGALKEIEGVTAREAERAKNMFALGLMSWLYGRPTESTTELPREEVREAARDRRGEPEGVQHRLRVRRDVRGVLGAVRGEAGAAPAGAVPPDHRQHRALVRPDRRVEALRASTSSSAPTRSRRRRRSSRSSRGTRRSACAPSRPRTRSPPSAPRSARRSAARSASRRRPGRASCSSRRRSAWRSRSSCRSLIIDVQRAGPVDRHADEARAGRPADGALRPQLGVAGAGDRAVDAGRLLLRRDRGGARRAHLPHAGLPALRRVPRERRRAVADPGRRARSSRSTSSSRPRTASRSCRTSATRRRSRGRGRSPARRVSSTASAGSRRRTRPATSRTTPRTTT